MELESNGVTSHDDERNEIYTAFRWTKITDGCDGVAVSTVGCGPASPGSSPGHGPIVHYWTVDSIS
jgi:hypothetical protein